MSARAVFRTDTAHQPEKTQGGAMTPNDDPNHEPDPDPVTDPESSEEAVRQARHQAWIKEMRAYDWSLMAVMAAREPRYDQILARQGMTREELELDNLINPAEDAGKADPPGGMPAEPTDEGHSPPSEG
jgi:hypothetical protein